MIGNHDIEGLVKDNLLLKESLPYLEDKLDATKMLEKKITSTEAE